MAADDPLYGTLSMFPEPAGASLQPQTPHLAANSFTKAWLRLLRPAWGATDPCSSPTGSLARKKRHYWDPTDLNKYSSGLLLGLKVRQYLCFLLKRHVFASPRPVSPSFSWHLLVTSLPFFPVFPFPPCFLLSPSSPSSAGSLSALWLCSFESECCRLSFLSTPPG